MNRSCAPRRFGLAQCHAAAVALGLGVGLGPVTPAAACDLALVLAVDISGSVDPSEYRIQMDGLAAALRDGVVSEALVHRKAQVTLIQWTGSSRQRRTIPWTAINSFADVETLALRVERDARVWRNYSTAIGEALNVALGTFDAVPDCRQRIVDLSGDGRSNEGTEPRAIHDALRAGGVVVNALAIETGDNDLTSYFYENVITGEGAFVVTANGFEDYPAQIRRKLQRETTRQVSRLRR